MLINFRQTLPHAMVTLCDIMTVEDEGGSSRIPFDNFTELYTFLAKIDGEIGNDQRDRVLEWLKAES